MKKIFYILFFFSFITKAQHHSKMTVAVDIEKKTLTVKQELTYFNQSNDTLSYIILNDWNNAYSNKNTPLAKRFSDEFESNFYLAKEKERGKTLAFSIFDKNNTNLTWERNEDFQDVIHVRLRERLAPNEKMDFVLTYQIKIPSDKFTRYGYGNNDKIIIKNSFLIPARHEENNFIKYNNLNLDDIANSPSDYDIEIVVPQDLFVSSDLNEIQKEQNNGETRYSFSGKNRLDFCLYIDRGKEFEIFKNSQIEVVTNLKDNRLNDIHRSILIDKITTFVAENLGKYPHERILVSQTDYDRNPFYGLNQLPVFVSPFPDEFLYEIKFLKTYLNNYLHGTLRLNPRKDNWIYDGIQIFTMMKYIEEYYPESKMMGNISHLKILRGYNLVNLDFNEQYSYFYMLMARKNLDQPLGDAKNTLIKFNEKIASKYRAGLSLKYLDSYLENNIVPKSIQQFIALNQLKQTDRKDFEEILTTNSPKKINWFFNDIIYSRNIIDFKFKEVTKTKDTVNFTLLNKTQTNVPIPIYGIKDKNIVFKHWVDKYEKDSIFSFPRNNAEKIVINYKNEVPEYNLRNNWKSLKGFRLNNRPIKFNFMKDLEDPYYNQILYVPTLEYNYYDGFLPGIRFHNKTILDKPFIFDVNPTISTYTKNLSGKASFYVNQYNRNSQLYNIRYLLGGHYLHYAPDAYYKKLTPTIALYFRPNDYRNNKKETLIFKETIVNKEKSAFVTNTNYENYEIFSAKYITTKTEITHHFHFSSDFQYSKNFGKLFSEVQFRKRFRDNNQLSIRLFTGAFLYNKTSTNYFDFGLDRPTDYLFESDYLGRSETQGIFSQQSIMNDGFFKSKLATRTANQWMTTTNVSYSIWKWFEIYGDLGLIKNKNFNAKFVYDNGIRLNLVPNYFELYFPVYSNNGWEVAQKNYAEKIRFIITFDPKTLTTLFTRKWF